MATLEERLATEEKKRKKKEAAAAAPQPAATAPQAGGFNVGDDRAKLSARLRTAKEQAGAFKPQRFFTEGPLPEPERTPQIKAFREGILKPIARAPGAMVEGLKAGARTFLPPRSEEGQRMRERLHPELRERRLREEARQQQITAQPATPVTQPTALTDRVQAQQPVTTPPAGTGVGQTVPPTGRGPTTATGQQVDVSQIPWEQRPRPTEGPVGETMQQFAARNREVGSKMQWMHNGDFSTEVVSGKRFYKGQPISGGEVTTGPRGDIARFTIGGQPAPRQAPTEAIKSLTERYNKALDLAGRAETPGDREKYERLAGETEQRLNRLLTPAERGGERPASITSIPQRVETPETVAPPPWENLSGTSAMAKRTEMTNTLSKIKEAISSGDESVVRKYFSDPRNKESKWLFTQLGRSERDYIAERAAK